MIDKKDLYIDNLVLQAKTCSKENLNNLFKKYNFLFEQIFKVLVLKYEFLRYSKPDIFSNFYYAFISAIGEYKFQKDDNFSIFLQEYILDYTRNLLKEEYNVFESDILGNREIKVLIRKNEKSNKDVIKKLNRGIKCLTPRQKSFLYLNILEGKTHGEIAKISNCIVVNVDIVMKGLKKSLNKRLYKKDENCKEPVYDLAQLRLVEEINEL